MKSTTIATQRTVQPFAITAIVIELVRRSTGVELDPAWVLAVAGVAFTFVYRVGRELERKFPWLGRILFGSTQTPVYNTLSEED